RKFEVRFPKAERPAARRLVDAGQNASARSAGFHPAVSRISNPQSPRQVAAFRRGRAQPTGSRRHSRLEICATKNSVVRTRLFKRQVSDFFWPSSFGFRIWPGPTFFSMNKPTLLIVDDEKPTREGLRAALEDRYDVYLAEDAGAATELLEREHFDVLLTD